MENYQKSLDEYISALNSKPKLALNSCCAPCSSYVLTYLSKYFDISLYYYNPNIYPKSEYEKRRNEQIRLCDILGIRFVNCEYQPEVFFEYVKGFETEPEGGKRCAKCFELRLKKTAELAKYDGINLLATTLTVSPHKNARLINEIGERVCEEIGIEWLKSDFKKRDGYLTSIRLSKQYGLYRQNYCGCLFSKPIE